MCPPGWKRRPDTGDPYSPAVGAIHFRGPGAVSSQQIRDEMQSLRAMIEDGGELPLAVVAGVERLVLAANHGPGVAQLEDTAIQQMLLAVCRSVGVVEVERHGNEWVEIKQECYQ